MSTAFDYDVIVIGAGAAGLMCAATAAYRGRKVLVLDHAKRAGRKILISGGGRCNFTNVSVASHNFLCSNPHFVKSALARYPSQNFIELVERHGIEYHERSHGQLFCNDSAKEIVELLLTECEWAGATVRLREEILDLAQLNDGGFEIVLASTKKLSCESVVVATGGLSMPKLGATPLGYKLAQQFGLKVLDTYAGLVPFTWHADQKQRFEPLSGIAVDAKVKALNGPEFKEALLFTHRGLSGPAALQASSYWVPGETIHIDLLPETDLKQFLAQARDTNPKQSLKRSLTSLLPKRLVEALFEESLLNKALNQLVHAQLDSIETQLKHWDLLLNGTEGYRTAEVTMGGVDTNELSSKTMQSTKVPGLYFVGEVMDVSGWLGGFNFQWAWASGVACGLDC